MNTAPQLGSLGKYRLIASIGHGGMAHIHLALMAGPAGFNKLLVIKSLRDDVGMNAEEFVTMFLDEARLAARLSHPNIVQTYEVGESDGRFFIAMEYLEGQSYKTVERRVRGSAGMPLAMHLRILSEVAKGLHHAHELRGFDGEPLGVVHRDVSPHNVFLTYDGQVKLLDFGIAKAANAMHLTRVGVIKGKAEYIAPEQIRGEEVDRRADVFALGVMLWEALVGQRFAGGPEVPEITKMHNRLTGGEPRLRALRPDLPEALVELCEKAIALDPTARHETALAFSRELDGFLSDSSIYPTAQQLSDAITPLFTRERDQLRKLIDAQMKTAMAPGAALDAGTGQLPAVPRQNFASGVWQMPTSGGHTPTNTQISPGFSADSLPPNTMPPGGSTATGTQAAATGARVTKPAVPWPALISALIVAAGAAIFLAMRPSSDETRAAAKVNEPPLAVAPRTTMPDAPAPDMVRVTLEVSPNNAVVMLDGARIRQLPFHGDFARSSGVHTLDVTAPGHKPHREVLTYDRDLVVRVRLEASEPHSEPILSDKRRPRGRSHHEVKAAKTEPALQPPAPPIVTTTTAPRAPEVEPGMDFKRLAPKPGNQNVELEEDPYR